MLAYARRHALARPPELRAEILLDGLQLSDVDEAPLPRPFRTRESSSSALFGGEQLCITKDAAILIHPVVRCENDDEFAELPKRPRVCLELPLERRKWSPDRIYTIPHDLTSALASVIKLSIDDIPDCVSELRTLVGDLVGDSAPIWTVERYQLDSSAASLLQTVIEPEDEEEVVSLSRICVRLRNAAIEL